MKNKILLYLLNKVDQLENEYNYNKQYMRYHNTDECDYLDLIISKSRKDLINEIAQDLIRIIKF